METKELVIDNRFRIQSDTHLLTDLSSDVTTRLEPRLMKLLFLLATHPGQLVSREQIIRDIWNDYGGGEDGLTQAISFLRKMLDDVAKDRIRTIPKKGYLLNAVVTPAAKMTGAEEKEKISVDTHLPAEEAPIPVLPEKKKNFWTHPAAITLVVTLLVLVLIAERKTFFPSPAKSREPAGGVEDTLYQYQELKEHLQQQPTNP